MALYDPHALENPELVHAAQADVQGLYFRGAPLYSKEAIEVTMARLAGFLEDQPRECITIPDIRGHEREIYARDLYVFAGPEPDTWVR